MCETSSFSCSVSLDTDTLYVGTVGVLSLGVVQPYDRTSWNMSPRRNVSDCVQSWGTLVGF